MKASIIIPAFNAEKGIGKCLTSLQKQEFKDFEVIVVDDGSSDNTGKAAKSFKGVRVLRQKNSGPAVARNNGAKEAKGDIIIFTDSDCVLDKNWLREMLKPFEDKSVAGVQGTYRTRQKEIVARLIQLEIEKNHERMGKRKLIDFMGTYSAAYRKVVFLEMNGFDTSFPIASGEDTDLSFRVSAAGHKMMFNDKALVFHTHPTSLWKYLKIKFFRAFWRTKVYKKHKGKIVKDSYTSQAIKLQVLLFYLMIPATIALIFEPGMAIVLFVLGTALNITTLPFAAWAFQKDKIVGLIAPTIIVLRTIAFGLGLGAGTFRELVGK